MKVTGDSFMYIVMGADDDLEFEDWFGFVKVQKFLSKNWGIISRD